MCDYGLYGVWVNVVCLGWVCMLMVDVEMELLMVVYGDLFDGVYVCVSVDVLLWCVVDFDEIVVVCVFLVLLDVLFVIGVMFVVDGGVMVVDVLMFVFDWF